MQNLSFRLAQLSDIQQLLALHYDNLYENLQDKPAVILNGFVRVRYEESDFMQLVEQGHIAVAHAGEQLIGYYLTGCETGVGSLEYQRRALQKYFLNDRPLSQLKIAYGAQAVIKKDFRGQGITERLLQELITSICSDFDYLFSSITKFNKVAFSVHQRSGYMIVGEDEERCYVLLKIN
jgi:ribosomal protein S18 acetylase RimI-like enzyme